MRRRSLSLMSIVVFFVVLITIPTTASAVRVRCEVTPVQASKESGSGGAYRYKVYASGESSLKVESQLLILDRSGNILRSVPIRNGDIVELSLWDVVRVRKHKTRRKWLIRAPAVLFRARATENEKSAFAYCSPFATIRLDQPEHRSFAGVGPDSSVPIRLVAGFDQIVPGSIKMQVDGVDLSAAVAAGFAGGAYSRATNIAGARVTIKDVVADLKAKTISFTFLDLPDGDHRISIEGDPSKAESSDSEKAASGTVKNERTFTVERSQPPTGSHRLVYVQRNLRSDNHIPEIRDIVGRASEHGFNGVVFEGSFDGIGLRPKEYFFRLASVKKICEDYDMELIPLVFCPGYGGGVVSHNRNLAAAIPVKNVPFVVKDGVAVLERDPAIGIQNGSCEEYSQNRVARIDFHDKPGEVSFVDNEVAKEGNCSLRFDHFEASDGGKARVIERVTVQPFRCYRFTFWLKTEDLDPSGGFWVLVLANDGRRLMSWNVKSKPTQDWQEVHTGFNSLGNDEVRICAGVWKARGGRFWVDGLQLSEVGLLNVLRRTGTPIKVRNDNTGASYREGEDFQPIKDSILSYRFDHAEPVLTLNAGSRIGENERLRVDYYQALALKSAPGQIGVCLSNPDVHDIWSNVVATVHEHLQPHYYFINVDEVRHGGWCERCENRGLSSGELLGDCITRQVNLIKNVNPNAEVIIWSDMLDPHHNAKDSYYLVNGDLRGSWAHVPKDLIIACWLYKIRDKSLQHFDELGFRTIGCGYYDTGNLDNAEGWLASLNRTPGSCGIMYTTWKNQYQLLESFGDLVREE